MRNYIKRTDKMDIYIETGRKTIVVRQKWKYSWLTNRGTSLWTYEEKRDWHQRADEIVWNTWGNGYKAIATSLDGTEANRHLHLQEFKIEFDIEWVLDNEHWEVEVTKVPPGTGFRSRVNVVDQIIYVISQDIIDKNIVLSRPDISFNTFNHEYGHTLYPIDDYGTRFGNSVDGPHSSDLRGLMTIGDEFRLRYVSDLSRTLQTVIPRIGFTVSLK